MGAVLMSFTHRLDMKRFVDFQSNVAPRLSLKRRELLREWVDWDQSIFDDR